MSTKYSLSGRRGGFSLVELLVVIGVISLLISMLMPALAKSREQARRLQCLAALSSIAKAAQMHINEHKNYLPLAGWHWNTSGGICNNETLEDSLSVKYDYYIDDGMKRPLPFTAALAQYMGPVVRTDSRDNLEADLESPALRRLFHCPSQNVELLAWTERGDTGGTWTAPLECSSYVFNEAVLGRRDGAKVSKCPQGNWTKVMHTAEVFFVMDGRPRSAGDRCFLAFDYGPEDTMYDFDQHTQNSNLGNELLDYWRHDMHANVVFLDWHAETIPMSESGLKRIGVSKGIYP